MITLEHPSFSNYLLKEKAVQSKITQYFTNCRHKSPHGCSQFNVEANPIGSKEITSSPVAPILDWSLDRIGSLKPLNRSVSAPNLEIEMAFAEGKVTPEPTISEKLSGTKMEIDPREDVLRSDRALSLPLGFYNPKKDMENPKWISTLFEELSSVKKFLTECNTLLTTLVDLHLQTICTNSKEQKLDKESSKDKSSLITTPISKSDRDIMYRSAISSKKGRKRKNSKVEASGASKKLCKTGRNITSENGRRSDGEINHEELNIAQTSELTQSTLDTEKSNLKINKYLGNHTVTQLTDNPPQNIISSLSTDQLVEMDLAPIKHPTNLKGKKEHQYILSQYQIVLSNFPKPFGILSQARRKHHLLTVLEKICPNQITVNNILQVTYLYFNHCRARALITFSEIKFVTLICKCKSLLLREGIFVSRYFTNAAPPQPLIVHTPIVSTILPNKTRNIKDQTKPESGKHDSNKSNNEKDFNAIESSHFSSLAITKEEEELIESFSGLSQATQTEIITRMEKLKRYLLNVCSIKEPPLEICEKKDNRKTITAEINPLTWTEMRYLDNFENGLLHTNRTLKKIAPKTKGLVRSNVSCIHPTLEIIEEVSVDKSANNSNVCLTTTTNNNIKTNSDVPDTQMVFPTTTQSSPFYTVRANI